MCIYMRNVTLEAKQLTNIWNNILNTLFIKEITRTKLHFIFALKTFFKIIVHIKLAIFLSLKKLRVYEE